MNAGAGTRCLQLSLEQEGLKCVFITIHEYQESHVIVDCRLLSLPSCLFGLFTALENHKEGHLAYQ